MPSLELALAPGIKADTHVERFSRRGYLAGSGIPEMRAPSRREQVKSTNFNTAVGKRKGNCRDIFCR